MDGSSESLAASTQPAVPTVCVNIEVAYNDTTCIPPPTMTTSKTGSFISPSTSFPISSGFLNMMRLRLAANRFKRPRTV